jgi:hypothetical protein
MLGFAHARLGRHGREFGQLTHITYIVLAELGQLVHERRGAIGYH